MRARQGTASQAFQSVADERTHKEIYEYYMSAIYKIQICSPEHNGDISTECSDEKRNMNVKTIYI